MKQIVSKGFTLKQASSHRKAKAVFDGKVCFFNEPDFNEMLHLERRRSDRSMKPLMMMRLDISRLKNPTLVHARRKLMKAFATGIRDTDVRGWCKQGDVFGILFTNVVSVSPSVRENLLHRVMSRLVSQFDLGMLCKIKLTFLIYVADKAYVDNIDCFDMEYYKDFVNKNSKFSLSATIKNLASEASDLFLTNLSALYSSLICKYSDNHRSQ